jgi:hypoxanthine phosphoribosyltransferase
VTPSTRAATTILLIDDVITKGRTLAAAAIRLQEAFPKADIRAFALIRTMGFVLDIPRLLEPCQGVIHWNGEDAYRAP